MKCNYANEKDLEDMKILLDYLFHNKHFLQASKRNSWSSWYIGDDAEFGEFKFKQNNVEVIVLYQGKWGQEMCIRDRCTAVQPYACWVLGLGASRWKGESF